MPRGKNCRETFFAAQLPRNYPHHGDNFERRKKALSCGGEATWEEVCQQQFLNKKAKNVMAVRSAMGCARDE